MKKEIKVTILYPVRNNERVYNVAQIIRLLRIWFTFDAGVVAFLLVYCHPSETLSIIPPLLLSNFKNAWRHQSSPESKNSTAEA